MGMVRIRSYSVSVASVENIKYERGWLRLGHVPVISLSFLGHAA